MDARDIGLGSGLAGFGVLFTVAALMYEAPVLIPFSYALIGAGLALFLRGFAEGIAWSLPMLLVLGGASLFLAAFLLVSRRNVPDGLALASLSLGWSLALVAAGAFRTATAPAPARPPAPARRTFK